MPSVMNKSIIFLVSIVSVISAISTAQSQTLRDDFNRAATTDIAGSLKWRRVLNLNDTSATIQLNADSTVSPRNLLGPFNRGAAYWDTSLAGRFQVGMVLRHKNGNDGVPTFHLQIMNDSSWTTGNGYALRYQANPGQDRMDIQRITASGTDTPTVNLLATLNREFIEGDTIFFKFYPDGRKTAVVYGVSGQRDSMSVVDTVYNPASWIPWIQGRVFADPVRMDNFMLGPIPYPITAIAGTGGSIAPSGVVLVDPGGSQSFTITPDPGLFIVDVKVDTLSVGAVGNYAFTSVDTAHTIEALFDTIDYVLTATAGPNGTITPSGTISVSAHSNRSFAITPDTGYHIDSVVVDSVNQGATAVYEFLDVMADHSISAYFTINTYTVTASASAGGTIAPPGATGVTHGSNQAYSITPNTGYHIDSVVVDGTNQGALANYSFLNVTANHAIVAYFSINTYSIAASASAGGAISPSGAVQVNHGSGQAFTVTANTGHHIDSVVVDGLNQGAVTIYTFPNVTAAHAIAAYFTINSYTIAASAQAGGAITPTGSVIVTHGSGQAFTISPDTGYHVDSVVVDGVNQGAVADYSLTNVTANHAITAYFTINTYIITASASAGGVIAPPGATGVTHGSDQSFTMTPDTGYHVDSVVVDGANQGAVTNYDFTNVTAGHSIAAYFSINTYTVSAGASSGGSIFPFGAIGVTHGDDLSFTITANTGSHVDSVVVDGVNQGIVPSYDFTNITDDHLIQAYFSINSFTITATSGAGGSISPSGAVAVNYGANRAFTIAADAGYHIDSVVVDGTSLGAVGSYNFLNVTADHAIAAHFSINTYTITATAGSGGTLNPQGSIIVDHGNAQSFTVTPDTGYHTDSVVVDGVNQGPVAGYDFNGVTANHSIAAYFSIEMFTVTASTGPNGSIAPAGVTPVAYGDSVSYMITPAPGYYIADVQVDSVSVGALAAYAFTGVTGNHTIQAFFSITPYTIVATAGAGGSIAPAGLVGLYFGDDTSFTVTADTGYHVDSVLVDGVNQGPVALYAFTDVSANHSIAAHFSIDVFTISASTSAGGSITPSGAVSAEYGSDRSFAFAPDTGHHLDSVVVDGVNLGVVVSYDFTVIDADHTIAAYFSIDLFTVTALPGSNGSITPSGVSVVAFGDSIGYAINPDTGYYTVDVHVDTLSVGPVASYAFTGVASNHTISATFAISTFLVNATTSAGGVVTPEGSVTASYGDTVTVSIQPDTGYHIDSVVVDGINVGPVASYNFLNVTAGHTLAAYFSIDVFTISASAGAGGTISPAGGVGVGYGADQAFTITPSTGYRIDSVVVDGANAGPVSAYGFTNVNTNHSIVAHFSLRTFLIVATAGPDGAITPSGSTLAVYGDSLTFTITPDPGYHVDSIVVDGVDVGVPPSYAFNAIDTSHTIEAWFSLTAYTITAGSSTGGSILPSGVVGVSSGTNRVFTMTPTAGFHVDSVVVDGVNIGAVTNYTFFGVTTNHTIDVYHSINVYAVTSSAGSGGGISPSGTLNLTYGSTQAFTITPATGYLIQNVLVDGVTVGQPTSYTFTNLSAAHSIQAFFALRTFAISANAGSNGTVTPAGTSTVSYGDSIVYTITPNPGFYVQGVMVDGVPVGVLSGYVFRNVTAAHSISATFTNNATPTAFSLVSPADGRSVPPTALGALRFTWRKSFDANPGDLLKYVMTLGGPGVNFSTFELTDTAVTLDLRGLAIVNLSTYRWTVRVSDGTITVASPDTFDITIDPTTGVGDDDGGLPKAYAMRQNYPNPFNPSTSVPFDLPERSEVRIAVYNIIGVEMMTLVAGENLAAGAYLRNADFAGLSTGAYFCRMSAKGESGAVYDKVIRLVLMR